MTKAEKFDEIRNTMKLTLSEGYALYEDGEIYLSSSFISLNDAIKLAKWVVYIASEQKEPLPEWFVGKYSGSTSLVVDIENEKETRNRYRFEMFGTTKAGTLGGIRTEFER